MKRRAWLLVLLAWTAAARAADENPASRVVILANSDDPDSLRIAQHYAEARGVPMANIVAQKMPLTEAITWPEFVTRVWQPLLDELIRQRWIDAIAMAATDAVGRRKYAPNGHRIAALVVCRGVPLKINHDPWLVAEVPPYTKREQFRTNEGAVDSELSLLAQPNYPINAFVANPLFQNERPTAFDRAKVVMVSRLDGPTADDALALVDRAMEAERTGLLGRAYVDIARRDPVGDGWLEAAATQLNELGFDLSVDREPATFPATARIDAPAIYFGWYSGVLDGPFALPGFRFPPGAIALHIQSFTASTLRSTTGGWTGPLVARGVTATVGNVFEPYLDLTHRPHLLLRALARGDTLAEAAYYSMRVLSWQAILIGDPLYRPFAVSLDRQMENLGKLPPLLAGYAVLRRMNQLDAAHRPGEATALALSAQREAPSLAVGLALAQRLRDAGDNEGAGRALGFVSGLKTFSANEWALVREIAQTLEACGQPARAVELLRTLLANGSLPPEVRGVWQKQLNDLARSTAEKK